ncbi:ABC-three component system middle component 5 [Sulfitobacter sp. OXR-159]|uniref:ABC-three component system middle component 5 n=1 Tax=Sulfitobacter sp. OXR-159 TaxID=3100174 RepID=UPI0039FC4FC6
MRMIAIHAQTERKRLDRSVRCAEKRRPWARKQRLRGLIRPDPAVCATAGAACGRKSLSSDRIQAIFTSNDTPPGECRLSALSKKDMVSYSLSGNQRMVAHGIQEVPEPLLSEVDSAIAKNQPLLEILAEDFVEIEVLGPGGLKDRSGLEEYQYDTV